MPEKIKLTFLGTASAVPTAKRNHIAVLLNYGVENILFDCGEGTQRQFRKAHLNPCKLTKILITHWHGDHVLGLPGLFQTLALNGYKKTLEIYGPVGTKRFVKNLLDTFVFVEKLEMRVTEIEKDCKFLEGKDFFIEAKHVKHGTKCLAYNFVQKGELRIDKKKISKFKISPGVHLAELKKGKDIVYEKKKYKFKDLTFKEVDKKISFVMDTAYDKSIGKFVEGADVLISEASFLKELESEAKDYKHLTAEQAGKIAKEGHVKKLILVHLSQRYENNLKDVEAEARKVFKNSDAVKDLDSLVV